MFSPCSAKRGASDKDLPLVSTLKLGPYVARPGAERFRSWLGKRIEFPPQIVPTIGFYIQYHIERNRTIVLYM